jgi:hypothetical protein
VGVGLAKQTVVRGVERMNRLYEQGADVVGMGFMLNAGGGG